MEILRLTLKKKWFDMIASGVKKEEYREIKRYWIQRLCNEVEYETGGSWDGVVNKFDCVIFKNGYSKNAPSIKVEWLGMKVSEGKYDWGAEPGKEYFVIKLGEIIKNK